MNKKGLQLKNAFFAVIAVSMFIIAVGVVVGEWGKQDIYNSEITYDLSEDYNKLDTMADEANVQKGKVTPQDPDPGTGDFEGKMFSGGYGILGRMFTPFNAVRNMFNSVEQKFDLPDYVGEGVMALMVFALIFSIIAIIFRLGRTSA